MSNNLIRSIDIVKEREKKDRKVSLSFFQSDSLFFYSEYVTSAIDLLSRRGANVVIFFSGCTHCSALCLLTQSS
jgi:hypothetical protein